MRVIQLPQLTPDLFKAGNEEGTYFHGPSLQIMGTYFHTFAFAVDCDPDKLQPALDEDCEMKFAALQQFYEGRYETVRLGERDCVLVIHPYAD